MVKCLTENQYEVFVEEINRAHIRDQCILLLMLQCGLRNGEVCRLKWGELCIGGEIFHTFQILNGHSPGKLRTKRYVTVTPLLRGKLSKYRVWCLERLSLSDPDAMVFISFKSGRNVSVRDIQRISFKFSKKVLGRAFHPHALRHTFATRLMRCTNIRVVQQLLGHRSLQSTQVYTHPSAEDRDEAIKKAF